MNQFKVIFYGGPYNGAERYYHSLSSAKRVSNQYVNKYSILSDQCSCDIFRINADHSRTFLFFIG